MMLYLSREVSEVGFNMIIKSSTAMPCVVLDQNTIYQQNSVLIIIIFITLTPIEPEVHLWVFTLGRLIINYYNVLFLSEVVQVFSLVPRLPPRARNLNCTESGGSGVW